MKFITNLDLNKNELRNAVLHPLATAPSNPKAGQIYFNSTDGKIYCYYSGSWIVVNDGDMRKSEYDNGGAKQVVFTGDSRLSDARVPTAHKNSHKTGGSDALSPSDIGAYAKPSGGIPKTDLAADVQTSLGKADSAIQTETDPVFVASPAHGITSSDITNWNGKLDANKKGAANGVAELDSNGKVPSGQLPSFVDDVLEYASQSSFPSTGETGKIYVAIDTNKTYRWSGSAYVEISASLALGETSSTAYRGDRGKTAYDHSQATGNPHSATQDDIGDGSTYKRYSNAEKTKLAGIDSGATANTITLNGAATKTPSFYAPTGAGISGQVLTSNGSGAPTWQAAPESVHKYTATNSALTASGGAWTWNITAATHGISNNAMFVSVYEVNTGAQVVADVVVNQSTYAITVTIVDSGSAGTLTANTYRVVAIG